MYTQYVSIEYIHCRSLYAQLLPGGISPKDGPSSHVDVTFLVVDSRVDGDKNVEKPIERGESL